MTLLKLQHTKGYITRWVEVLPFSSFEMTAGKICINFVQESSTILLLLSLVVVVVVVVIVTLWGKRKAGMHSGFRLKTLKERVHLIKSDVNVRITLQLT